jgi:DNA-binding SARP family transcriptional activator
MANKDRARQRTSAEESLKISLLGGFTICAGQGRLTLPLNAQRVLVALSLRPHEVDRGVLGATLYPDGTRSQVSANLRSALWRARKAAGQRVVDTHGQRLCLAIGVEVDLQHRMQQARSLVSQVAPEADGTDVGQLVAALSQELLPTWNEEWLILERQRWDDLRLHALERLADQSAAAGRHMDALEAGHAAVAIEPYRESAYRALIRAYIAEGNSASALALYHRCQRLLMRDLGVRPTPQIQALVRSITGE